MVEVDGSGLLEAGGVAWSSHRVTANRPKGVGTSVTHPYGRRQRLWAVGPYGLCKPLHGAEDDSSCHHTPEQYFQLSNPQL